MRPPVIDGIEELHSAGHFDQLAQDSELARAGRIEELDFLESGPHDREPPVMNRSDESQRTFRLADEMESTER